LRKIWDALPEKSPTEKGVEARLTAPGHYLGKRKYQKKRVWGEKEHQT